MHVCKCVIELINTGMQISSSRLLVSRSMYTDSSRRLPACPDVAGRARNGCMRVIYCWSGDVTPHNRLADRGYTDVVTMTTESSNRLRLMNFFDEADADRNGYLSMKELKGALKKQGYNLSRGKFKKQFALFDLDGDNRVSRDEFLACMGEVPETVHQGAMVRKMFVAFDKNGDGFIDRGEISAVFAAMRQRKMAEVDLDTLVEMVDVDKDGRIDYEEFVAFFEKKFSS